MPKDNHKVLVQRITDHEKLCRIMQKQTQNQIKVQQYMQSLVMNSIGLNATKALKRIVDLSDSAKSEYVQLEASKDILDRAGYKAPDKVMHSHVGNISVNIDLT